MTTKGKIKQYNLMLQKYLDNKDYVKINRMICGNEENLSGFILKMSSEYLLLQLDDGDFMLDGYAILRKDDFDSIKCGKYEKTKRMIFKSEGIQGISI